MLRFVGMGIGGDKGISMHALNVLSRCDIVYLDRFTGFVSDRDIEGLNTLAKIHGLNIHIRSVKRWFIEDGREILEQAQKTDIAILTYGDPFIATTFIELYVRALKRSIEVDIIHGASGITSLIGEVGLHIYKFGKMVTITSERPSRVSVYTTTYENLINSNHTLILMEYDNRLNSHFFLDPGWALQAMLRTESELGRKVFLEDTFVVVASRVGTPYQRIISGTIKSLCSMCFGHGPHSIIVTGGLHFTELDALMTLTQNFSEPKDNTKFIRNIPAEMIDRYAPMAREALSKMRRLVEINDGRLNEATSGILCNAECYIDDAEKFLEQGKPELAILSMGYAEGLIDALSLRNGILPAL